MVELAFYTSLIGFAIAVAGGISLIYSAEIAHCQEESCEHRVARLDIIGAALLALGVGTMIASVYGY